MILNKLGITEGPLSVRKCPKQIAQSDKKVWPFLVEDNGYTLAIVQGEYPEEDARLISCAPDMLEALIKDTLFLESINGRAIDNAMDDYIQMRSIQNIAIIEKASNMKWDKIKELLYG